MNTTSIRLSPQLLVREYYYLTKPGIVYGNGLAAAAGYIFGAGSSFAILTFVGLLLGISSVIASACVYNNILDRKIDAEMTRTKKRALVSGAITKKQAFIFGTVLLLLGALLLVAYTNMVALFYALCGHVAYVLLYTYSKRYTVHGTLIGTISGSTPPVIGYAAATGGVDITALVLFLVLVAWQMPHFYAIALFRRDDYAKANIPVLSVVKGEIETRRQIIAYVILFMLLCVVLGFVGASLLSVLILILCSGYWLYLCLISPDTKGGIVGWSRQIFGWSLIVLLVFCSIISLDQFFH